MFSVNWFVDLFGDLVVSRAELRIFLPMIYLGYWIGSDVFAV